MKISKMKKLNHVLFIFIFLSQLLPVIAYSQTVKNVVYLKRGRLWETFTKSNLGKEWNAYRWRDYAMEWPGYDPELPGTPLGDHTSHHAGSGFLIGALKSNGKILGVANFASTIIQGDSTGLYLALKNEKVWGNGENYWLRENPNEAQDVVETIWEYNKDYIFDQQDTNKYHMPIRVKRTARQWSGDKEDQDYIIISYKITNTSNEILKDTYIMFGYTFIINRRGWNVLGYQSIAGYGDNDDYYTYDPDKRLIFGNDGDNLQSYSSTDDEFDFWDIGGPKGEGEWASPGYVGLKFLYISPNKNNQINKIDTVGWGFVPRGSGEWLPWSVEIERRYQLISGDISAGDNSALPQDWGKERMVTMAVLGPWDLQPGDSISVVTAEMVAGIDYKYAIDPKTTKSFIRTGLDSLMRVADKAQFNYDHNFNIPDPPAAPDSFTVGPYDLVTGNELVWNDSNELIPDPDYSGAEAYDFEGYRIYRSEYSNIGGWELIADVKKGEPAYYNSADGIYRFVDRNVQVGFGYFYSITSYDSGHNSWPPDPGAFPNGVPSLETSKFVNKSRVPFYTQQGPGEKLEDIIVVPNPFVIEAGFTIPRDVDRIQFIGVPGVCTIRIYTVNGDLVKVIEHTDGTGVAVWDQVTDSQQFVASGIYIYHLSSHSGTSKNNTIIGKFAIIR